MKQTLLFLFLAALLSGCSDFGKAVKSKDVGVKMSVAEKYFAIGEQGSAPGATRKERHKASSAFERTLPLLEELTALTRGDTTFERVSYMYAKSYYGIKDFILGGYYLENFAKTFPTSRYAEECTFLAAMCQYRESPEFELDQEATKNAIDQMQLFLVRYPDTKLTDSCNVIVDRLRKKLERKDYENAMLYVKTRNYEAASLALADFVRRWPNSPYREEVFYSILLSDHDLALNSIDYKKAKRIEEGIHSFDTFADAFPQSEHAKDAERLRKDLVDLQERLKRLPTP